MRKAKIILKTTDYSREYNAALKELKSKCHICKWHNGCNSGWYSTKTWKKHRKKQYYKNN